MGQRENCVPLLIPSLRHVLARHCDTFSLESQLCCHIGTLICDRTDSLLALPLSVLSRSLSPVLTLESSESTFDRRRLFDFLVRCLNNYGPSASILFRNLSADCLTVAELSIFHSHPNFQSCFIGQSVGTALIRLSAESEKQRLTLSSLSDPQSPAITGLVSRISEFESRRERLSGDFEARFAATDGRLKREIEKEAGSMGSKLAAAIQSQSDPILSQFRVELKEQSAVMMKQIQSGIERTGKIEEQL
jgi:hypothetical protein